MVAARTDERQGLFVHTRQTPPAEVLEVLGPEVVVVSVSELVVVLDESASVVVDMIDANVLVELSVVVVELKDVVEEGQMVGKLGPFCATTDKCAKFAE